MGKAHGSSILDKEPLATNECRVEEIVFLRKSMQTNYLKPNDQPSKQIYKEHYRAKEEKVTLVNTNKQCL